jgi:hypothetical protein
MRLGEIIILIMFFHIISNAQNPLQDSCNHEIFLSEYNVFFSPEEDTISIKLYEGRTITVFANDCLGDLYLKEFDDGILLREGQYARGEKLLRDTRILHDPITYEEKKESILYFQPVKKGIWVTYNKDGSFKEEIKYN